MNKFQKVACKLAKLERDSGKLDFMNKIRLDFNKKYNINANFKPRTFRNEKNVWYNAMKRGDVETIQIAYVCLAMQRQSIQYAKERKLF